MKKIHLIFIVIFSLIIIGLTQQVLAGDTGFSFTNGLVNTGTQVEGLATEKPVQEYAVLGVKIFLSFLGMVFLILIIYSGFVYMTSGGQEDKITKSKKIIISAVIGLVLIISGYSLTIFIATQLEQPGSGQLTPGYQSDCENPYNTGPNSTHSYNSPSCCEYRYAVGLQADNQADFKTCCGYSAFCCSHRAECEAVLMEQEQQCYCP